MGGNVDTGLIGRITLNIREEYRLKRKETREHNKKISEKNLRDIGPKKISMSEIRDYILGKPSDIEELDRLKKADEHLSNILNVCVSFRKMRNKGNLQKMSRCVLPFSPLKVHFIVTAYTSVV